MRDETLRIGYPYRAVLGYRCMEPGFAVRVCSWCSDAAAATKWAAPLPVTHSCCERHAAEMRAKILGEKIEA